MKQSDLEFLLKLEKSVTNNLLKSLQNLYQEKQAIIDKRDILNKTFLESKPDIHVVNYSRFIAIENKRLQENIEQIDKKIMTTQEDIRNAVREEKKYDILKQEIIATKKKKLEQTQENQSAEYTIFQYSKPNTNNETPN